MKYKNKGSDNLYFIETSGNILCNVTQLNINNKNNPTRELHIIDNYKLVGELNVDGYVL